MPSTEENRCLGNHGEHSREVRTVRWAWFVLPIAIASCAATDHVRTGPDSYSIIARNGGLNEAHRDALDRAATLCPHGYTIHESHVSPDAVRLLRDTVHVYIECLEDTSFVAGRSEEEKAEGVSKEERRKAITGAVIFVVVTGGALFLILL